MLFILMLWQTMATGITQFESTVTSSPGSVMGPSASAAAGNSQRSGVAATVPPIDAALTGDQALAQADQHMRAGRYSAALALFKFAAGKGNAEAEAQVGLFLEQGLTGPRDLTMALAWYQRSTEHGDSLGPLYLGQMYEIGTAVTTKSIATAQAYYSRAAKLGLEKGQVRLVCSDPRVQDAMVRLYRRLQDDPTVRSLGLRVALPLLAVLNHTPNKPRNAGPRQFGCQVTFAALVEGLVTAPGNAPKPDDPRLAPDVAGRFGEEFYIEYVGDGKYHIRTFHSSSQRESIEEVVAGPAWLLP